MKGRIKAGEGTLIGNSGEYYVMGELLKRGVMAALAPRNAPSFDILATKQNQTIRIRVKTKSHDYHIWQWSAKKDGTIFRNLTKSGDFTVLVGLAMDNKDLKFYVIPTHIVNEWLISDFDRWVRTPGKHNRPHSSTNPKRTFSEDRKELNPYLNNWDILWEKN